ncbi:MAG: hypothetical protein KC443_10695 [Anaerolineales bacterium]|nr:hypothetical protein [Anaerolineales bacterium]MCB8966629.1 hypothetical protein [Ardenticatenaceae bacterium]
MRKYALFLTLIILLLLSGTLLAMSSDNFRLDWFTPLTTAGGGSTASTNYEANFTIGQTVIGRTSSTNYRAGLGYWGNPSLAGYYSLYLPIIRN